MSAFAKLIGRLNGLYGREADPRSYKLCVHAFLLNRPPVYTKVPIFHQSYLDLQRAHLEFDVAVASAVIDCRVDRPPRTRGARAEASSHLGAPRHILREPIHDRTANLQLCETELREGLRPGAYLSAAARLFELRIRLAEISQESVSFELQAAGGRACLTNSGEGFQRRWREAAFVPIITPRLVQLKAALASQRDAARQAA